MPLFKGEGYKCTPDKALEYITRPDKALLVSSLNLDDGRSYARQFRETARSFGKCKSAGERKYYHFKLSADPKDNLTPTQSQRMAEELATELFPNHECVITTHVDTNVVHSHIIVNSVNFETGRKLHVTNLEYAAMKDLANDVAAQHGHSTLNWRKPAANRVTQPEKHIRKEGKPCWKDNLRGLLEEALDCCDSFIALRNYLEVQGVTLSRVTEKTISFVYPGQKKAVRGNTLGEKYTRTAIEDRLQQNRQRPRTLEQRLTSAKAELGIPVSARRPGDGQHTATVSAGAAPSPSLAERLAAAKQETEQRTAAQTRHERDRREPAPDIATKMVYCRNLANARPISLTLLQTIGAWLLGQRRHVRHPFDYRAMTQARYNIKLMSSTMEFLARNGMQNYADFERRMQGVASRLGKLELELKQVTTDIPKLRQIHTALLNFQANERIAQQYINKVLFRDNFYRQHEEQLKAYAKAQEFLRRVGVDPHSSAPEIKARLDALHDRQADIANELRAVNSEWWQWRRIEQNLQKMLDDRLPKYRLDVERTKQRTVKETDKNKDAPSR